MLFYKVNKSKVKLNAVYLAEIITKFEARQQRDKWNKRKKKKSGDTLTHFLKIIFCLELRKDLALQYLYLKVDGISNIVNQFLRVYLLLTLSVR